jgi:two-component system CheB/CheR fusion protein
MKQGAQDEPQQPEGLASWPAGNTKTGTHDLQSTREATPLSHPGEKRTMPGPIQTATRMRAGLSRLARRIVPLLDDRDALKQELVATQEQLQAMTEEHSTAVEELRSANEELHSVNEEMQSANEELETSKEEIQSVNEELHAVNAQLSTKLDELDRTNSDLRNLFESTEIATVFLDRDLIILGFTPAVASIYNLIPSDQGRPLTDIVSRVRYDHLREDVEHVLRTLEPMERRVVRHDSHAHYIMRVLPYRAPDSTVSGTLVTFLDVTSIVQAEQHQRLLVDELNHRVKNMLTVVISLASQTLRRATTLEEFSAAFMGRVHALTASYTLLSQENWVSVSLLAILKEEMRPFTSPDGTNVTLDGPEVRLGAAGALALGMAVHELATNAVKYGALSELQGKVCVTWRFLEEDGREAFVLDWIEKDGPPVAHPTRRGFGMTVIERGFAHELGGHASVDFARDGLRARLKAPVGPSVAPALETAVSAQAHA